MELIIENVRSFLGRHDIPIKPLTLLVGENSSGKTTLLSLLSATSDTIFFPLRPNFNLAPYNLGNFDTIATHRSAGNERAASFRIGSRLPATLEQPDYELTAEYTSRNGAIEVSGIEAKSEENSGVINFYLQEQQSSVECLLYREGRGASSIPGRTHCGDARPTWAVCSVPVFAIFVPAALTKWKRIA